MDPPEDLMASDGHGIEIVIVAKQAENSEVLSAIAIKQTQDSEALAKNSEILNAIAIKQPQNSEMLRAIKGLPLPLTDVRTAV